MKTKEFHKVETYYGPPLHRSRSFRMSQVMAVHVENIALIERCDPSTVIRHALHEYFLSQGFDCFNPLAECTSESREDSTRP